MCVCWCKLLADFFVKCVCVCVDSGGTLCVLRINLHPHHHFVLWFVTERVLSLNFFFLVVTAGWHREFFFESVITQLFFLRVTPGWHRDFFLECYRSIFF